jgi:hypothetical protein
MQLSSRCRDVIQIYRCILLYLSYSIYSFVISEWMAFCCYISVFHLNSCRLNRRSNARIAQPTLMHKNVRNVTNFHCSSAQPEVLPSCGNKFVSPSVEKSCRSIVYFPLAFSQIKRWCEFLSLFSFSHLGINDSSCCGLKFVKNYHCVYFIFFSHYCLRDLL